MVKEVENPVVSLTKYLEKAKASLTLDPEEKKQMMEWMDLEKNAAILHKTDKAIAQKIRTASAKNDQQTDISEKNQKINLINLTLVQVTLNANRSPQTEQLKI